MSTAIHWFRRDLRLTDNTALAAAVASHDRVLPVYVRSNWRGDQHWTGPARQAFLCGCLESLDRNLQSKDVRLVIRSGNPVSQLEALARETKAEAIYFNRDPDPHGRKTEAEVEAMAARLGIKVVACKDHALHERDEVLTNEGKPYRVFTPYARAWSKLEKPTPSSAISRITVPADCRSEPLPTLKDWGFHTAPVVPEAGERAAQRRLDAFLDGPIFHYADTRDLPAESGTSRLSQDLRHGTLSIREVHARCMEARHSAKTTEAKQSVSTFINELIWREFYFQVLWHWPEVLDREFLPEYRNLPWRARWRPGAVQDTSFQTDFKRWENGCTGFPIVDAGMRQLQATGFIHNRVRMIVAMFLTKDLHIWWMHGESCFMRRLVDGEIASNNGGWQWSASTGTDAAPYFRIQNPWSQSKRYDPEGAYIKQWVPELRDVPARRLSTPPTPGESLARNYPAPMVDHAAARERTLELFREARSI